MKTFTKLLAGASLGLSMIASPLVAETTLTISSWLPPTHQVNTVMMDGLMKQIEEATGGEVKAEMKHGLAPPPAQMDLIIDGAADIAFIFHGYQPGRFVATKLVELPGFEGNAEASSVAYWRVHEAMLAAADEHRGVKVIGLTTHGPGVFHSNKAMASLADLKDLKIRIGGGVAGDVGASLGVKGIRVPAPKVYETLASGAADGVAIPMESRIGFKLTEVAANVFEMPGGFYRGSFAVIMSQEAFDALPEAAQKALDEEVFGEPFSRLMGAAWDSADAAGRKATMETEGNSITTAGSDDVAAFAEITAAITAKVLDEVAATGIDAQAAYDLIKAEMAKE